MARKPLTHVDNKVGSNLEDRDSIIIILLKRMCTFEEAMDYLLSAIPYTTKDDMLGELSVWDNRHSEMKRTKEERRKKFGG